MRCIAFLVALLPVLAQAQVMDLPAGEAIGGEQLAALYAAELGPFYDAGDAERVHQAHELLERYFDTPLRERPGVVREIAQLGVHVDVIGRLTRLRTNWPALGGGVYRVDERVGPHAVRYYLGVPQDYDRLRAWPVVVRLVVTAELLADPPPLREQLDAIYSKWIEQELALHPDALVLMPVPHPRERFGPGLGGVNAVIQPLLHAGDHANIDPARVHLVGHGMAAQAAWNLALHHTTYFTSFQALASPPLHDWQRGRLINLGSVMPVVWHDADDDVAAIAPMRQAINTLRRLKHDVHFNETRGIGHIPTAAIMEEGYRVMRQHERPLYPAQIALQSSRPETVNNRQDWMQVYQPARPGSERRILIRGGPEHLRIAEHPWLARANIAQNRVEVRTDNVLSMRLYFNDQLLDLDQPVTIILNGRQQYQGPIERNLEEMLKDQIFLGRGWRYYTAMIDVGFE